ncbi:MAG TPA: hypothetical protein VGM88_20395 [Kofleriaceae bacterium]|jgi:hypothetical protein
MDRPLALTPYTGAIRNVYLMDDTDLEEYKSAIGKLRGGEYHYIPALSTKGVSSWQQEALLPSGHYTVVVERPREALVFTNKTSAHVVIEGM